MRRAIEAVYFYLLKLFKIQPETSPNIHRIASNTSWLVIDNLIRSGMGFFIGTAIARYLGPEKFGILSYCSAFVVLFSSLATLGLDSIVIRDVVLEPDRKDEILGTAFVLKLCGSLLAFVAVVGAISLLKVSEPLIRWLVGVIALSMIFQSVDVIDYYFQAKVQSKYVVWMRDAAFLIFSVVRIYFICSHARLECFAYAALAEVFCVGVFLFLIYRYRKQSLEVGKFSWARTKHLFRNCWPGFLSGIAVMIYMKIDQLILEAFLGNKELGIYVAAIRLLEIAFIPGVILTATVFPVLLEYKKQGELFYQEKLKKVYQLLIKISLGLIVINFMFSKVIISSVYGVQFARSADILSIVIFAALVVYLGMISGYDILSDGLQKYSFYRTALGAISSVALNFLLIPLYGIKGAAWSLIISFLISVFSLGLFRKTRKHFLCLIQSFVR